MAAEYALLFIAGGGLGWCLGMFIDAIFFD